MPVRTRTAAKRLVLGRETLRTLGAAAAPHGAVESCGGGCSCLCIPDTALTGDLK